MGKKATKTKNKPDNIKKSNVKGQIITQGSQGIGYQGKISIKIMRRNKVVKTLHYHNKGLLQLFKFIGYALAGTPIENLRPCKIKLYTFQGKAPKLSSFNWKSSFSGESGAVIPEDVSPFIIYDTTPTVKAIPENVLGQVDSCEVTYHFRIPFSLISSNEIYMVGLYGQNTYSSNNGEACAYFLYTNDAGTDWDPLTLSDVTGNYSLIIDWTLTIMNSSTTTN